MGDINKIKEKTVESEGGLFYIGGRGKPLWEVMCQSWRRGRRERVKSGCKPWWPVGRAWVKVLRQLWARHILGRTARSLLFCTVPGVKGGKRRLAGDSLTEIVSSLSICYLSTPIRLEFSPKQGTCVLCLPFYTQCLVLIRCSIKCVEWMKESLGGCFQPVLLNYDLLEL